MSFVPVQCEGVLAAGPEQFPCVVLRNEQQQRVLPVWIHPESAGELSARLAGLDPRRPTSYELLKEALGRIDADVVAVRVISYFEGVFIAHIVLDGAEPIDCRPSDAVIIATLMDLPIEVDADVFKLHSVFVGSADPAKLFDSDAIEAGVFSDAALAGDRDSAVGDEQADADFAQLLENLGVTEDDLMGGLDDSGS